MQNCARNFSAVKNTYFPCFSVNAFSRRLGLKQTTGLDSSTQKLNKTRKQQFATVCLIIL